MQKISIITITYNDLVGLKKTWQSIKCQKYKYYEWIVIDGGSTDGSKEFIIEHACEMSYWCSEKDKGVYNAQNKGTQHASGEYVIYMNSGDYFYDKHVLEKVFSAEMTADIIYGDWTQEFADGEKRRITCEIVRKKPHGSLLWELQPRIFLPYASTSDRMCHYSTALECLCFLCQLYIV